MAPTASSFQVQGQAVNPGNAPACEMEWQRGLRYREAYDIGLCYMLLSVRALDTWLDGKHAPPLEHVYLHTLGQCRIAGWAGYSHLRHSYHKCRHGTILYGKRPRSC